MADVFAPKLSSDIRFNEPVEKPSMLGALADVAGGFLSALPRAGTSSSSKPKTDPNLAAFSEGLNRIQSVRDQKGELAAQVEERKLATNFAAAGINFDSDYQAVYEKTTGRPWSGYGADIEARTVQETLAKPEVQANYIASFVVNPDWTEAERIDYAIGEEANLQFYKNEIEKSKAKSGYTWSNQSETAYNGAIDTFLNTNLGAVVATAKQGGRVGPQALANISAQWSQMKVNLSRPSGVSDEQWKATQAKIDNVDGMLATLTKAGSSEVLFEEITTALAGAIMKEGGGGPDAAVAAMMAIKSPDLLNNLGGLDIENVIMKVSKSLNLDLATPSLFGHIVEDQGGLGGGTDPNALLTTLPSDVEARIKGKTPQQIFNGLEASGILTSMVTPNTIQGQDARDQFVENAATIGAVLKSTTSDQFLSNDMLKKLIANPGFIANVNALDAIDPEAASVTRTYVRSGLDVERVKQAANLGSIEQYLDGKGIVWNGADYVATPTAPRGRATAVEINSEVIKQAKDRRSALITIEKAMSALAVTVEGGAGVTVKGGAGSDTLSGAGSGSSSTSAQITYALPEAIAADTEFLDKVVSVSSDLGFDPNDLLRVIDFETAGSFSPKAQPIRKDGTKISSATGLIQFLEKTAKGLGTTTADLANMTAVEQLDYVKKYFEPYKDRIKNFGDVYMAVHWPKGVGKDDSYVMYEAGSDSYNANKSLDTNGDGTVTRGETLARLFSATGKGGNPTAGTPANANTVAAAAGPAVQRAVENAPSAGTPALSTTSPTPVSPTEAAPMEAVAALPEAIPTETAAATGTQGASELSPAIAIDKDVQAFIQEIAGNPDKTYASEADFVKAQESGELEAGDTVVVDGSVYVIRKDGSARRLGSVNA